MIFSYLSILAAAGGALAVTPPGFSPGVQAPLFVLYSDSIAALNGATMSKMVTAKEPFVGTEKKLTGKSYAVIMVDMDVPTSQPPKTRSLLHWMQTDLVPVDQPTTINTTAGTTTVYPVSNLKRVIAAAPYFGPDPPARVPLNHRYTQVLIDTSNVGQEQMRILSKAATKREDFNVAEVLSAANIPTDKIVAGNFFQVTNNGPAQTGGYPSTPKPGSCPSSPPSSNATKPMPQPAPQPKPPAPAPVPMPAPGMSPNATRTNTTMPRPAAPGNGTSPAMPKSPAPGNGTNPAMPKSPAPGNGTNPAMPKSPAPGNGTNPAMPKSPTPGNGTNPAMPKSPAPGNGTNPTAPKPGPLNPAVPKSPVPGNGTKPMPGLGSNGTMPKPGMSPQPAIPPVNAKASSLSAAASVLLASVAFCILL
ncbi:hypothetical protein MCOR14_007694 [Pyricularia oryzae]|nr:hypothetical protein MCOR19_003108 [Pyricularia oryzae]KAI6321604.1 hypothetical protein MCOR30_007871 [Pyricularia oryzae]KAI6379892.1 hypothetical protein MCOR32_004303 [Pyricularia oryzae]KAI6449037.1 hypothetical protein MCOR22_002539 [Pyricularia oryzae]KAI6458641.1 hypothetical protein MCOR18_011550 [Pyricularia oryzae]